MEGSALKEGPECKTHKVFHPTQEQINQLIESGKHSAQLWNKVGKTKENDDTHTAPRDKSDDSPKSSTEHVGMAKDV